MALADAVSSAVAHWTLDAASGNETDTINSIVLTDNNTVGTGTGKFSNARDFETANSEYLSVADNGDLSVGDIDFAVRCWVQLESKSANLAIITKDDLDNDHAEYRLYYDSSTDRFAWQVPKGTNSNTNASFYTNVQADNFGSPSTGTWYLIHAWHDSTANEIGISVNAGTANTAAHSVGPSRRDKTAAFAIGTIRPAIPAWHFDGLVDDVVILKNYLLDSTERTEDYNSGTGVAFADWSGGSGVTVDATTGALEISGLAASVSVGTTFTTTTAALEIAGLSASVSAGTTFTASTGTLEIAGLPASISAGTTFTAGTGALEIAGLAATVNLATTIEATTATLEISGLPASVSAGTTFTATTAALEIAGLPATVEQTVAINAAAGTLEISGLPASISASTTIAATTGALEISGLAASVSVGTTIAAGVGALEIAGLPATVDLTATTTINASLGTLEISGLAANISVGTTFSTTTGTLEIEGLAFTVSVTSDISPVRFECVGVVTTRFEAAGIVTTRFEASNVN